MDRGQIVNVNCQEFYSFCKTTIKLAVAGNGGLAVKLDRAGPVVLPHPTAIIQECGIKKRPARCTMGQAGVRHPSMRWSPSTSHEISADVITCVNPDQGAHISLFDKFR